MKSFSLVLLLIPSPTIISVFPGCSLRLFLIFGCQFRKCTWGPTAVLSGPMISNVSLDDVLKRPVQRFLVHPPKVVPTAVALVFVIYSLKILMYEIAEIHLVASVNLNILLRVFCD